MAQRFNAVQVGTAGLWNVIDAQILTRDGNPAIVRAGLSQATAASLVSTLNSTRADGPSELRALFPTPGAASITIGNTSGGSVVATIGTF
jgi:hypothetical protein